MVLGLKPMGKLIVLDKYLIVGQNKSHVWILGPQSLERLVTSSIYSFPVYQRRKPLGPQTYEEICTRGLTFFVTHSKKKKSLRYVGSLELLLSVKQNLSCTWVLGPNAWEKQILRCHYKCRTEP